MPRQQFRRLGLFYLMALGGIALSIIVSQVLIQTSISRQQDDAHVINVAGRQRMLSQNISKLALQLEKNPADTAAKNELSKALYWWEESHLGLQYGNEELGFGRQQSDSIREMFRSIEPHFQAVYENALALLNPALSDTALSHYVEPILAHEKAFLRGMDLIVYQYDTEAQAKVSELRKTELYLFIGSLMIIVLELIFIFRPLAGNVRATVQELISSEESAKKMTGELSKLYEELGKSYQDLEAVNIEPESPSLYASLDHSGTFTFLSSTFLKMMEYEETPPPATFQELLSRSGYKPHFSESLLQLLREQKNWTGELRLTTDPGDFCWLEAYLIPVSGLREIKLIARNITEFKEAKVRSRELNRERIEKSVKEQHYRSALILQGQEEERKRLSRELHDGVGQMLSAMKMLLESLTPSSKPMQMRLRDAKDLMKSIIQEVRRVSFNLTPSSLDDFGLLAAVSKFCEEIDHVSKSRVEFLNETRFINRMESTVETNLYRIIQEAVNNALKYAKAQHIQVRFAHNINTLHITIQDDGRGFDYSRLEQSGHFEKAGHGIFNMKERTSYIGGTFDLATEPGKGTRILITLSLDKND